MSHNLDDHKQGISWEDLPKTFQDVVRLARGLHVPYVWIDALCIIQDSADDWQRESALMARIYGDAHLVVIAANARSVDIGFLHKRTRHLWEIIDLHNSVSTQSVLRLREALDHQEDLDPVGGLPVSSRGWCFQERLMGKRRIIYQDCEFVWECRHGYQCECSSEDLGYTSVPGYRDRNYMLPMDYTPSSTDRRMFKSDAHAYDFWRTAVQDFTAREITFATDRFLAISAIANVVQGYTGDEYLAGLWRRDLLHELMWTVHPSTQARQSDEAYVAPSWSWARQPQSKVYYAPVLMQYKERADAKYYCGVELASYSISRANANQLGPITAGHIVLRAYYADVDLTVRPYNDGLVGLGMHAVPRSVRNLFDPFDAQPVTSISTKTDTTASVQTLQRSETWQRIDVTGKVRLLWLLPGTCLILAFSRAEAGAFERLGIYGEAELSLANAKTYGTRIVYGETKLI